MTNSTNSLFENEQDWNNILETCVMEMHWNEEKSQAVKDLIRCFQTKENMFDMLNVKLEDLQTNIAFINELIPLAQELTKFDTNILAKLTELYTDCLKLVENDTSEKRYELIKKITQWLDSIDIKDINKLIKLCTQIRAVFIKVANQK